MLSIVICSRAQPVLQEISKNVAATIGVPYEIIAIDNSGGKYSIFQAYNLGISQSKYEYLCFMHEDIAFETQNWGQKVLEAFAANPKLGLLGVAGSSYKPAVPSGWSFDSSCDKTTYINIIQHYKSKSASNKIYSNPRNERISPVVSVDGVWFCTTREAVDKIKFDEATFAGFHCYDVDFSLSVLQHYEVAVTFEVLINHFSEGSFDDSWTTETLKLHDKWRHLFPVNLAGLSAADSAREEFKAFHALLPKLVGKAPLCRAVAQALWQGGVRTLVGAQKFAVMNLLLLKKGLA
ncbi:MAG: hypothetical protein EOO61_00180 [Hymenobacter sp.]|nr:MAG: hypothetical protein EOO61_00180 [Hymenobacter sp.]